MLTIQSKNRISMNEVKFYIEDFKGIYQKSITSPKIIKSNSRTYMAFRNANYFKSNYLTLKFLETGEITQFKEKKTADESIFSKSYRITGRRFTKTISVENNKTVINDLLILKHEFENSRPNEVRNYSYQRLQKKLKNLKTVFASDEIRKGFFILSKKFKGKKEKHKISQIEEKSMNLPQIKNKSIKSKTGQTRDYFIGDNFNKNDNIEPYRTRTNKCPNENAFNEKK